MISPRLSAAELDLLRRTLACPVAPFHETAALEHVRAFAGDRGWRCKEDRGGNLAIRLRRGRAAARWCFTAHLDHPGFIAGRTVRRGRIHAEFLGSVASEYFADARVRFLTPDGPVRGIIECAVPSPSEKDSRIYRVRIPEDRQIPPGSVGQWELPSVRRRGTRMEAVGCDDLSGVAAILCALDRIASAAAATFDVTALFTRAEEVGFVGAMAALKGALIPPGAWMVSVENSKAQPYAPQGGGVVIRAGDRARIFDAAGTAFLGAVADTLAQKETGFRAVRALMPGGVCESTVFHLAGLRAAAVCIPLENYHNQGPAKRPAPERIHLGDFASLVALLSALPSHPGSPAQQERDLKKRLHRRFQRLSPRLKRADALKSRR